MDCINIKQYEFVLNILDNVFIPIVHLLFNIKVMIVVISILILFTLM